MNNIGRYQIIEKIGFGGTAIVYKAHDPQISRTLAIKVLREERCADKEYRSRFLREAKAVGVLSHPNIVTIYDVGEVDNTPYIAMELLEGQTLDEIMKSGENISLEDTLHWGIQLADALSYAHSNGIVHRDIKPSNIVLSKNKNTIKITDFGIAHLDETDVTQHTQLGEVLGTPQYMSPEQVLGKSADARSDLFSVGVILYQLLTGQKPFQADTLATLLFLIATENPEPIGQVAPHLPGTLKQTVDKLLKKKPEKRFQSGIELKQALQKAANDLQESKQAESNQHALPIKLKWSLIMGSIVTITLLICGSYFYQLQQNTMIMQVYNYGASLAKFVASENAEEVLSENWANIELYINDNVAKQELKYLRIIDHKNIIRGSNYDAEIGTEYAPINNEIKKETYSNTSIKHYLHQNEMTLDIATPIVFQTTVIGQVHLGLSQAPVIHLSEQMLWTLAVIAFTVISSVIFATYILGKQIASPISILNKAMHEIETGHYSYRIDVIRQDEFGQLFSTFDKMAAKIQEKYEKKSTHKL